MGRVGQEGFEKDANYEQIVADATLAERTKMDAAINWWMANSWEEAKEVARGQCTQETIKQGQENRFRGEFVSENNAMHTMAKIAGLSEEEQEKFFDEFYTQGSFSEELRAKISDAFKDNPEEKLIKVLRSVHVSWDIDQSNKFEMWNDKKGIARNTEHQFDDLLLMQYGEDGATADKLFTDTMFDALGIEIDEDKLKEAFMEQQKRFLAEIIGEYGKDGKTPHEALVAYLQSGDYISRCEQLAGEPLTTQATAIKNDPSRASNPERWSDMEEIPIRTLTAEDSKVCEHMASLIEDQVRANGIDLNSLMSEKTTKRSEGPDTDDGIDL